MQQGPEPSFNVSVDFGRFAPLMGAPSTLNMTPGGASASGVTGPAGTAEFSFCDMSQVRKRQILLHCSAARAALGSSLRTLPLLLCVFCGTGLASKAEFSSPDMSHLRARKAKQYQAVPLLLSVLHLCGQVNNCLTADMQRAVENIAVACLKCR
jgi:hypothetical protein